MFHWSDYVVFVVCLVVSLSVGLYHGLARGGQQTTSKYLRGGGHISSWAVAVSLAVTIMSSITVQGIPAESYLFGIQIILFPLGFCSAIILVSYTFIPLHYTLRIATINEYLEMRFDSKSVRLLGCFFSFLMQCSFSGCLMFGPATAMELTLGLHPLLSIFCVNFVGIMYTAVGGLTAVIYTDAFQSVVMLVGVISILVLSILQSGGVAEVYSINKHWHRMAVEWSLDPQVRVSAWTTTLAVFMLFWAWYGINQSCTQRYLAFPTLSAAKRSCLIVCIFCTVLNTVASCTGSALFAYYTTLGCDPVANKYITNPNQILPYFVDSVINYPTVSGLFISCLVSSALSSLSSSVNSTAALLWEDLFKEKLEHVSEQRKTTITRAIAVCFGVACTGVSFVAYADGGNLLQITVSLLSALAGPVLGMHLLGALIPWGNWLGALTGSMTSFLILFWMMIGQILSKRANHPLPTPTYNCSDHSVQNITTTWALTHMSYTTPLTVITSPHHDDVITNSDNHVTSFWLSWLYTVSYQWYAVIGVMICVTVGTAVSLLTGATNPQTVDRRLYFPLIGKFYGTRSKEMHLKHLDEDKKLTTI